uniref:Uncharacterized protein n=1 Tax=Ciona savignyi TaxID=51511 RepID=H2Y4L3_CIOSA
MNYDLDDSADHCKFTEGKAVVKDVGIVNQVEPIPPTVANRVNDKKTEVQKRRKTIDKPSLHFQSKIDEPEKPIEEEENVTLKEEQLIKDEKENPVEAISVEDVEDVQSDITEENAISATTQNPEDDTEIVLEENLAAYGNLMNVIGLEAPLQVIVAKNCTILTETKTYPTKVEDSLSVPEVPNPLKVSEIEEENLTPFSTLSVQSAGNDTVGGNESAENDFASSTGTALPAASKGSPKQNVSGICNIF